METVSTIEFPNALSFQFLPRDEVYVGFCQHMHEVWNDTVCTKHYVIRGFIFWGYF